MSNRKTRFKTYLIEISVVVFGILMAFQLNECSSDNKQQKLIQSHLDYLKEETQINQINLKYALISAEKNLKKIDTIFTLLDGKTDLKNINRLSFEILNAGYLYVRKNAYNSLINSGDIRFIGSFDRKKDIINMYEYYSWTQSMDDGNRNSFLTDFFPYVKKNFDLVGGSIQDEKVYFSKEFSNYLSTYRHTLKLKIDKFKQCKKEIGKFLKTFESK
ncbi:hypothetical protein [Polaribacter porphyrae]|uniref:Uncharacterized protein n=1 Tax=Polaribacter porphyrae TaxID=1137780 RepID=A0A2S7WRG8_9FLAO|nr:hypothetical protein [Polaribacter porphyrae]PQJ79911.1 hypothetical protein BTO18_12330 [Polaribacter porphyrae]